MLKKDVQDDQQNFWGTDPEPCSQKPDGLWEGGKLGKV